MTSVFAKGKLKAAKEAIGKKDYATAENAALQVLEYEPENYHALSDVDRWWDSNVFLGLASLEIGKNEQSENAYRKAIALNPEQLLAWQGLSKYYERTKSWNELAETLRKMMDLFAKAGDATKCAETLQRYVELRRSYGTQEEVSEAISLYLPDSPYYSVLSTLPPPDQTAPTSTTTFASQAALHNSLPILEELVSIEEKREKEFITKEVEKRRTRIGSSPLNVLKLEVGREVWSSSKLPRLYGEIIGHPQTSDELRRSTEAKLLRQRQNLLFATPASGSTAQEKKTLKAEVDELVNGFVLLKVPDPLAWNAHIERLDYERLEDYPTSILQQYLGLLPNEPLCSMIKAFLLFHGQPLTEDEEDDEGEKRAKPDDEEEEEPFALALEGFSLNQNSIFAHRTIAEFYLHEEDWDQARKVAESGLILIRQSERDYGGPLPLAQRAFNICIATALVYLFPPKHHLRAAGLLDDVLLADPDNVRCLMARAMVYQYAQNWKSAESIYQRVQAIVGSEDVEDGLEAREQAAWCAIQDGRAAETADEMRQVIDVLDGLDGKEYQQARAWWRLGKAYWDIADPVRASKCFQKAFELDPREGEAARRLAEGFAEEKEWDLVEVVASRTIAGEGGVTGGMDDAGTTNKRQYLPTNAWAWKAMGVVELNRGNYVQAIQAFQVTLRAEEADFESWLRLGEAYVHAGRHVAALKAIDRAQEINPDDWTCKFVKGDALRRVYQFDQAIEYFRSVLAIKPDDPGARIALAGTSLDLGKAQRLTGYIGRAEESLKHAVDMALAIVIDAPGFKAMAWKIIGDALYELGRRSSFGRPQSIHQTLVAVENALPSDVAADAGKTGHPLADASNELAQGTAEGNSAVALALAAYQARISLVESSSDAYAGAAYDVSVALNQLAHSVDEELKETFHKEAIDLLKKAVRAQPTNAMYWNALGVLRAFENLKLAQHSFVMSIEVDNKSPIAWTNLGLLYLYHEDLELANHAFYRAQTLDPDYSLAWVGQAIVATKNDHVTEARALLEHSITLSAAIPEADLEFASRIFALYVQGTYKAGDHDVLFLPFATLDRFSQQRPDDSTALHLFALICERLGQRDLAVTLMERVIAVLDAAYNKSEDPETERHFALAQVNLGRLRISQSEYADAIEGLKVASALLQGGEDETAVLLKAHASYCTGLAFFGLEEYAEALGTLETALEQVPEGLVAVRGQIILLLSQTLWQLGSEEARDAGKTQLLTAITEDPRNMDAITALAAYGMLNLDDDLLDAALSEIRAMPIDERRSLDPEGTVEHLLTHHHLGQGLIKDAAILMEASVHATPMASKPRLRLARLLIQQGRPEQARAVLAGLLDSGGQTDKSHVAEILSLAALALAQSGSKVKPSDRTALMEAQRAVFLDPSSLQARKVLQYCRTIA
ncbi:Superkiller protein 3 [Tulasnella sp. 417]|nr:Superkiller protein 3 [Tulasnella sp. 417]